MQVPSGMQEQFQDCLCIHGHCLLFLLKIKCHVTSSITWERVRTESVVCHEQSLCVFVCVCVCGYNSSSVLLLICIITWSLDCVESCCRHSEL